MADKKATPTETPPQGAGDGGAVQEAGTARPKPLTEGTDEGASTGSTVEARPSETPPAEVQGTTAGADGVTGTWRSGTVSGVWMHNSMRNAYMHVVNLGWKKIFNGRDGAFQALTYLASEARQTGRTIQWREEADGMVYEIYLW